ncbi:hypothetical protein BDP27DRAFT_1325097 [Rhodocollybia butyracea]|uniref:Uncharacterized protein n=1 Tax=Rhodocollybia butyracea TaxID=206335 RepID=A0A9P5PUH3_9AGAR|nr:hypothetical protein BDP27DRAFT_1325097 [Rhodocollybia butyracea]
MLRVKTNLRALRLPRAQRPPGNHSFRFKSSRPEDLPPAQTHSVQEGFAQGPIFVLNVAKRFIKFSAIGLGVLGLATGLAFEGTHVWVENVELSLPPDDAETRKWEWNLERENWSGDLEAAGTDPALGFQGRHLVRAAWMAEHWTVDWAAHQNISSGSMKSGDGHLDPSGFVDPRLVKTECFLRDAIAIAEQKNIQGKLRPRTMTQLLTLHAAVLERMGSEAMVTAKAQYERAWSSQPSITPQSARIALKLADLNHRLGHNDDALTWWSRTIHIVHPHSDKNGIPLEMPESPYAQRSLLFALSSLSAFYATTGNFIKAQSVAESALDLARSVRQPESMASISPQHAIHALTLLQRSSVLAIHLAEVLYAQRRPIILSTQWLTTAAQSSETVIRALTGLPLVNLSFDQPLTPSDTIEISFLNTPSLKKPAISLYRDSRRTAAEAWNLLGMLMEGKQQQAALDAYGKSVRLAGSSKEWGKPADTTLKTDWEVIWGNYSRVVQTK